MMRTSETAMREASYAAGQYTVRLHQPVTRRGVPAAGLGSELGAFVKRAFCVLGVGALICGSCAVMPVQSPVAYVSPEGQPAGYYPGLGTTTALKSELADYLSKESSRHRRTCKTASSRLGKASGRQVASARISLRA